MYLQLFGSLGCVILSCTSMRKMLLEILDDETGFKKKTGFISWKCRIYRGNSVEILVNIFIEVKTKLELFLFYSLSS